MSRDDMDDRTLPTEDSDPREKDSFGVPSPRSGEVRVPPERLGRYRILHQLGEGGMGVVFAAQDESLGRRIALKTIVAMDPSSRERFRREARAAAAVNHPNVCQVYEIGEDSGQMFIAMELLEGESLAERLKKGPMPVEEAGKLARGILAALQALHDAGTLHRDLKPSNVFLTRHGVKLLDFGLARPVPGELTQELEAGADLTRPGMIVGTPRYMAPEQVTGQPVVVGTDLFAAGVLLYEAVAGRPAFVGGTVAEILVATLHEEPPALAGGAAVVAFDRALRRALAKRPADRYASAREMLAEIEAATSKDASGMRTVARPMTRLAVLPFRMLRPNPDLDFLSFALADAVSGSLSGLPSVVIRPSTAVARFAADSPDLKALATEADVDLVLTGTLLAAGNQIRATMQLLEVPGGTLVSSQALQSSVGDIFRLQDELAARIVESLSPSLSRSEAVRPANAPASARAYEFYLRANEAIRDWAHAHVARDLYRECLAADPGFAPAWAKLGRSYRLIAKYHLEQPLENLARGEEALRKALEIDPDLAIAHKFLAYQEAEQGRAPAALARLLGVARRNRNDPETFAGMVHACRYCGLLGASEAAHREVRRLDPHMPTSVTFTRWATGDLDAVLREGDTWADFDMHVIALAMQGKVQEARDFLAKMRAHRLSPILDILALGFEGLLNRKPEEMVMLDVALVPHRDPEALFMIASCQAYVGDPRALESLTQAIQGGYTVPDALRTNTWFEGLRREGKLDALIERAEAGRQEARRVFDENRGQELLGPI
ncbi:MAG TPA: protein kinase [Thermoanaerobaculia bacterium]|nr:protein kinase [Thermoanaerobaculia bacterium]